jgi:hypothetical protein
MTASWGLGGQFSARVSKLPKSAAPSNESIGYVRLHTSHNKSDGIGTKVWWVGWIPQSSVSAQRPRRSESKRNQNYPRKCPRLLAASAHAAVTGATTPAAA